MRPPQPLSHSLRWTRNCSASIQRDAQPSVPQGRTKLGKEPWWTLRRGQGPLEKELGNGPPSAEKVRRKKVGAERGAVPGEYRPIPRPPVPPPKHPPPPLLTSSPHCRSMPRRPPRTPSGSSGSSPPLSTGRSAARRSRSNSKRTKSPGS
jgi:hypothetical protein